MRDMTRSFVLKTAAVVTAASLLLTGGLLGVRFDTAPQATAAPVPKPEMAKADDITDSLVELVSIPAVQRELKMSAESRVAIIDGFEKLDEDLSKNGSRSLRFNEPIPVVQSTVLSQELVAGREKDSTARRQLAASVLTKAQLVRLRQCEVQVLGARALFLSRVADELALTLAQKRAMSPQTISGQQGGFPSQQQAQLPNLPPSPLDSGESGKVSKALEEVVKDLTSAQEKKWNALNGEKVSFNVRRVSDQCTTLYTQKPLKDDVTPRLAPPVALPPGQGPALLPPPAIGR
jgi:hypothetical protein